MRLIRAGLSSARFVSNRREDTPARTIASFGCGPRAALGAGIAVLSFLRRRRHPDNRLGLGAAGERAATRHLKRLGYRILARNYRCPAGELDIIALDDRTVVFAEVRTRRDDADVDPSEWVPPAKQRQLARVARYYIHDRDAHERPCRFDVLAVLMRDGASPVVHHFPEAFTPDR